MAESIIQRSFAGGELAPALHARADTARYQQALRTCRNFIVQKEGGVSNRSGYRFIKACKDAAAGKRLMRYVHSVPGNSVLIEIGSGYFRFYQNGGQVTVSGVPAWNVAVNYVPGDLVQNGGVNYYCIVANIAQAPPNGAFWWPLTGNIYEIPTPYGANDKFQWNQSGNVITITHPGKQPAELIFTSLTSWVLQNVNTRPSIFPPSGGLMGTAGAAGARTFTYVITSAKTETYEESIGSGTIVIAAAADPTPAAPNVLNWTATPTTAEYYVYGDGGYGNGVFGFLGTTTTNSFRDAGFIPDFNLTPPLPRVLFETSNNFPTTSANFQQRRFFANTNVEPDGIWGSRTGFLSNFAISSPLQDDDAVTFRLAGNNHHPVRRLVALKAGLVTMTDGGEWTLTGGGGVKTPITPNSIDTEQETYVGIEPDVRPVVIGNSILYVQARGQTMHDIRFDQQVEGLAGRDLMIYASHLTGRSRKMVSADYQREPNSIVWAPRTDGTLLGLTYIPEQEVWGWHHHDTYTNLPGTTGRAQSVIEDVCVVPELNEDVTYLIVARTIGGNTVRYIEKMTPREIRDGFTHGDSVFVDSSLSYSGVAKIAFSGLDHLEGQVVAVLADGVVLFNGDPTATNVADFTVTGGAIANLPSPAVNVHIGLPIVYPEIELLDLDASGTNIRDKKKSVKSVTLLIHKSSRSFWAGPDDTHLRQYISDAWEPTALTADGDFELNVTTEFNKTGRVLIRQIDPTPLTILGVIPNVEMGG